MVDNSKQYNIAIISLSISAEEYLKLYSGVARSVRAVTVRGESIRFPASILRPFVTRSGIRGQFAIYFDEDKRFVSIEKTG